MSIADLGSEGLIVGTVVTNEILFNGPNETPFTTYFDSGIAGGFIGPFGIHGPVPTASLLRIIGNVCMISMGGIFAATDNNGIMTYTTTISPAPLTTMNFLIWVINPATSGSPIAGNVQLSNSGILTVSVGFNGEFTGASNAGFHTFTIYYPIA